MFSGWIMDLEVISRTDSSLPPLFFQTLADSLDVPEVDKKRTNPSSALVLSSLFASSLAF